MPRRKRKRSRIWSYKVIIRRRRTSSSGGGREERLVMMMMMMMMMMMIRCRRAHGVPPVGRVSSHHNLLHW
jgi:hypothetical protein